VNVDGESGSGRRRTPRSPATVDRRAAPTRLSRPAVAPYHAADARRLASRGGPRRHSGRGPAARGSAADPQRRARGRRGRRRDRRRGVASGRRRGAVPLPRPPARLVQRRRGHRQRLRRVRDLHDVVRPP